MKLDIAEKWVAELRSGKYKKGIGNLNDGLGNFCCLGVLCELAVKEGVISPGIIPYDDNVLYEGSECMLPFKVQEWAGLKTTSGEFKAELPNGILTNAQLWKINDNPVDESTFPNIADIIEAYAEDL